MPSLTLLCLALAISGASAAILPPRAPSTDASFLSIPVERRTIGTGALERRDDEVTLLNSSRTTYLFNLNIGTPPQSVDVVLDTGSFELWVDPTCSTASTTDQAKSCKQAGIYDPSNSSTVVDQMTTNELPYGKGVVDIAYVSDNVAIPGTSSTTMTDVIFGVGQSSQDLAFGIAGIGHGKGFNLEYPNLVDELALQGITNSRALSVALGSQDTSNGGVVIFGGVDTKKFSGKLYQFDNLPPQIEGGQTGPYRYWIQLNSIGISKPGGSSSTYSGSSLPIVLDTGSTLSYIPQSVINSIATDFSATVLSDGSLSVPCSMRSQSGTVDFTFGSLVIKVPYKEFIWEAIAGQCFVGVAPVGSTGTALLGDSFLRSAYVVMDQDNSKIYLAPYVNCGQNEKSIPAGAGAAANFTGECTAASAAPGQLGSGASMWIVGAMAVAVQIFMWLV